MGSIIAFWRFYQNKSSKHSRKNLEITSIAALSSMSNIENDENVMIQRRDSEDDNDELYTVHENETPQQNEESLSEDMYKQSATVQKQANDDENEDMYKAKKEETLHSDIITSDTSKDGDMQIKMNEVEGLYIQQNGINKKKIKANKTTTTRTKQTPNIGDV